MDNISKALFIFKFFLFFMLFFIAGKIADILLKYQQEAYWNYLTYKNGGGQFLELLKTHISIIFGLVVIFIVLLLSVVDIVKNRTIIFFIPISYFICIAYLFVFPQILLNQRSDTDIYRLKARADYRHPSEEADRIYSAIRWSSPKSLLGKLIIKRAWKIIIAVVALVSIMIIYLYVIKIIRSKAVTYTE